MKVNYDNYGRYVDALVQARIHEFDTQLTQMRDGLLSVIP